MRGTPANEFSLPDDVCARFNWGAFWLSWVWGLANGVYASLLVFVLPFVWQVYLGIRGNELAWKYRHFDGIEHFCSVQRTWAKWGWIAAVVGGIGLAVGVLITGGVAVFGLAVWETIAKK